MFTGIIQAVGQVETLTVVEGGARLRVRCPELAPQDWNEGDSIAVAGCCLTALDLDAEGFAADLSIETLSRTSLGQLKPGMRVNLEPALQVGDRLGGHFVTGHVDGLAELLESRMAGENRIDRYRVPQELAQFIAAKGSVTLDGTSLTVNQVDGQEFEINLIPHTLAATTFGEREAGDFLNLEIDLLARYLARLQGASE